MSGNTSAVEGGAIFNDGGTVTQSQSQIKNNDPTNHNIHPLPANNREWNKAEPAGMTMEELAAL